MRDFTTVFDWFSSLFFNTILGGVINLFTSFTVHGVNFLQFIIAVGLIGLGIDVVVAISRPKEKSPASKSDKKGAD